MESLALLCTLHADGPASLRRLRRAGCSTLGDLESRDPGDLARILDVPPSVARRLGREARGLSQRLEVEVFDDREEAPEIGGSTFEFEPGPLSPAGGLDRRDRAILGEVLGRWRRSDESAGAASESTPVPTPPLVVDGIPPEPEPEPEPEPQPAGPEPGLIDGLDESLCEQLGTLGIQDLAGLVEANTLSLARSTGRPFAALRRLQFLARREVPLEPEAVESAAAEPRVEVAAVEAVEEVQEAQGAPEVREVQEVPEVPEVVERAEEPSPAPVAPSPQPEVPRLEREEPREVRDVEPSSDAALPDEGAPRKFWEPRRDWVPTAVEEPEVIEEAPAEPTTLDPPRRVGRTLGWTFEIPPPPAPPGPPVESVRAEEEEGPAGPFA